jgi:hypothetical protein
MIDARFAGSSAKRSHDHAGRARSDGGREFDLTLFLVSCLPDRSHFAGHRIRVNGYNQHNRKVASMLLRAPASKNGAQLTIWRFGGASTQPECTEVKSSSLAVCNRRPSALGPEKWRLRSSEKRHFPPFFALLLSIFSGFFCELSREGAKMGANATHFRDQ